MALQTRIPLTHHFSVENGSHILYFYTHHTQYLDDVNSFIEEGFLLKQRVIYVDSLANWHHVRERFLTDEAVEVIENVEFIHQDQFYGAVGSFDNEWVLHNLKSTVDAQLRRYGAIRFWGEVKWRPVPQIESHLFQYEHLCDVTVSELGFTTVCAYDATQVPASILLDMMRTHGYFMTDQELVRSNLYQNEPPMTPLQPPSLKAQSHMESEVDLYKKKLDFIHVVSHEVRNPLTVIRAYASMLGNQERDCEKARKLQTIVDYAVVIDNEISHIIETEQMLVTESIWRKKLIHPAGILRDVLEVMTTKARTQNITLLASIGIDDKVTFLFNKTALKLIYSNIISNAIKYSDEGSAVRVTCECRAGAILFIVQDAGIGMTDEQVARLFRKYEKQNDDKSGQGIGLFMVKTLVDQLNGTITVDTSPGVGTTVEIRLPLQDMVE